MGENHHQSETDDSHLPRHERRYPFQPLTPDEAREVRAEANQILLGIWPMLKGLARRIMPESARRARLIDDAISETALHLALYSLPRYDAHHQPRTKVQTFLHRCARNQFLEQRKKLLTAAKRVVESIDRHDPCLAIESLHDRHIEALAEIALTQPEALGLSPAEACAIRAIAEAGPLTEMREIAADMGYAKASSLPTILTKARKKLLQLDVEGIELGPVKRAEKAAEKKRNGESARTRAITIRVQTPNLFTLEQAADWLNQHGNLLRPIQWYVVRYWTKTRIGGPDRIAGNTHLYAIETLKELAPLIREHQQRRKERIKVVAVDVDVELTGNDGRCLMAGGAV